MNLFQLFKNVRPFVKPYKWLVFITLILTLIGSLMAQVNAIVLDWTVDEVNDLVTAGEKWGQRALHIVILISSVLLGKEIPMEAIQKLLAGEKTELIKGFRSNKTRRLFDAYLTLEKGKLKFDFPPREFKPRRFFKKSAAKSEG